ncbi:MAG: ATP-binding protein [Eggerthellaceae bacterium]|nr:ATP-binding protein [Eggerthellaceae bacterium]
MPPIPSTAYKHRQGGSRMPREYLPRTSDKMLELQLEASGAVLVEGPKWCGKTTSCEQFAKSALYLQDPSERSRNLQLAELAPQSLLNGEAPRLLDEWQDAPQLWDAVRYEVDRRGEPGQFLLTGSTVPPDRESTRHSGTGRIARMRMRTMSLWESGDSAGGVSLAGLFRGGPLPVSECADGLEELAYLVCRGGWPSSLGLSRRAALQQAFNYLDAIVEEDVSRVDGTRRDAHTARMLLRSYSRMVSSQGSYASMRADMASGGAPISENTFYDYEGALRKLFVVDDLPAWNPNLRSKTAIRTSPTRHLCDPSVAVAALGAGPGEILNDLNTLGLLFESMAVRDLRCYASALDGEVLHYRDKSGLESDAVVRLRNGRYGLAEVKLGGESAIEDGAASLKALANRIDAGAVGAPAFLLVITGVGSMSYPRADGVSVVPLRALRP